MLPYRWEELTAPEFNEAVEKSKGLCILPIGCSERHGRHIVVGCDYLEARGVAELAAQKEYAVVFPTGFWLGDVMANHAFTAEELEKKEMRGYIALNPETLLSILKELCEEIHRNGFRKILFVNSHGGNVGLLNFFIRSQMYNKKDYATMFIRMSGLIDPKNEAFGYIADHREEFPYLTDEDMIVLRRLERDGTGGGHADFEEAAFCHGISSDYVRPEFFGDTDGHSRHKTDYLYEMGVNHGGAWGVNYPTAFHGDPVTGCSETIGKALLEITGDRLSKVYKNLKEDEFCVKISQRKTDE